MTDPPGRAGTSAPAWPRPGPSTSAWRPAAANGGRRCGRPRTGAARQPGFLRGAASRASGGLHGLRRRPMREESAVRSTAVHAAGPASTLVSQHGVRASRRPGDTKRGGSWPPPGTGGILSFPTETSAPPVLLPGTGLCPGVGEACPWLSTAKEAEQVGAQDGWNGKWPASTCQPIEAFGTVDRVTFIKDRETGHARDFGFVGMPDEDEARPRESRAYRRGGWEATP